MRFPEEMMIEYRDNVIVNKKEIINFINQINNIILIENYLKILNNLVITKKLNASEAQYLIIACQNKLENTKKISETFTEIKNESKNFDHLSFIETKKEENNSANGYTKDIKYLKYSFEEKTVLFEITNEKAVSNFLEYNQDNIKKMSEEELLNSIKPFCQELEIKEIDMRENDNLNSDSINKEINDILDPTVKDEFLKDQNNVLKERIKIKEFNKYNNSEKTIKYALNSLGKRIYLIGNITIKFEGPERTMKIIDNTNEKQNSINISKGVTYDDNDNLDNKEITEEQSNTKDISFDDNAIFDYNIKILDSIIEAISIDLPVTEKQINYLEKFLKYCVVRKEMEKEIPAEFNVIFEKYIKYAKENNKFLNENIKNIIDRNDMLKQKESQISDTTLKNDKVKVLKYDNNRQQSGFIVTAIIIESAILLSSIIAFVLFFKRYH